MIIAYISIFIALGCMVRDIKLATFISFVSAIILTILADTFMGTSNAPIPDQLVAMPPSMAGSFGAIFDFSGLTAEKMFDLLFIVIIFLIVDFFDGLSTIVGVGRDAGIIDKDGKVPNARSALVADAGGTVMGSLLGTTSVTAFSESRIAAFFTIMFTVLSFSPANGMAMGFISYAFSMVVAGKGREVHPVIYVLSALFMTYLVLL